MRVLRTSLVAALVGLSVLLAGCVSIPTSGRVERVDGQQQTCQNCVNVEVAPPAPGDDPRQVVEGFLRASANYQPSYSVARQFLTAAAAQNWRPEDGVVVYRGTPTVTGDEVELDATVVGELGPDRAYTARDERETYDFGLVRDGGEWRIGTPPAGLMVAEFRFDQFYSTYDLYFVGNDGVLVPDPIYLPALRDPSTVASALVKALLGGPTRWLAPAVATAIPPGTTLSVDSVTISNGVATVPLSDTVVSLPDTERSLLAAQIVYTLKQAVPVQSVLITVDQQAFRVPEGDPSSSLVSVESVSASHDPITPVASDQLYVVGDRAIQRWDAGTAELRRLPGDLGNGKIPVDALAVSVTDSDIAAVTDSRTRLVRSATAAPTEVQPVLSGVTDLRRPQFSRFGELWVLGRQDGVQKMWWVTSEGRREVAAPALRGRDITAFKISPDGTRVAFLERTRGGARLALALITRKDPATTTIDGWRPIDTTQSAKPQLTQLRDVGWLNATDLLVLGAATTMDPPRPYSIRQDASAVVNEGEVLDWDPVEVAVLLRTQTAVIRSGDRQVWRDQGSTWLPLVGGVTGVAFPG